MKPKDYEFSKEAEAATPYAVWKLLSEEGEPLRPGDLLELSTDEGTPGELRIAKYIGFEPAQWFVPEPKGDGTGASYTAAPPLPTDGADNSSSGTPNTAVTFSDQPSHSVAR